jgi:hypothetical protein
MSRLSLSSDQPPPGASRKWLWAIAVVAAVALLLAFGFPGFVAVYQLYWSPSNIQRLFYEDLGLSQSWSSFISVVGSFFYALAWVPLGLWTYRVLIWRFNARQFSLAFVCWVFVYGHVPLLHALLGTDVCFNQRTGAPLKWYVQAPNGEITLFDSSGYDTAGTQKLPVTPDICKAFTRQAANVAPRKISASVRDLQFFDPNTGRPRVWYYKTAKGTYDLFDAPGFSPGTSEPLLPVSKEVIADIQAHTPERTCFMFNGAQVCQ